MCQDSPLLVFGLPRRIPGRFFLTNLYERRGLLFQLVRRDFEQRFVGSVAGWIWGLIHPLVLLICWTFVFSVCLRQKLPDGQPGSYPLFLFAGMLPWLLFSETVQRSSSSLVEQATLITKTVFVTGPEQPRTVLKRDFRRIDPSQARIILIEGSQYILSHLPVDLSLSATRQLEKLGVQVRTSCRVKEIRDGEVELETGETIRAGNILWAAGVAASPLTARLGVELDRGGRVKVNPDLSLPGHPEVFAIGDMALVLEADGKPVPGVSPGAMQEGRHVARIIEKEIESGPATNRPPFKYWDKGTMATIGRSKAVAWVGRFKFSGWFAWLTWLFVHLIFLVGFRNKLAVLIQWTYSYFAYKRSARIITYLPQDSKNP